jgi:DNA-binding transcriptional MocR family regulator
MVPDALEATIERQTTAGKRPRLLYTVPHGQNPTGANMSMRRKQEIYAICSRHDVLILEDDPYCYLQYPATLDSVPGAECLFLIKADEN